MIGMADENSQPKQSGETLYRLVQISPCVAISLGIIALHVWRQGIVLGLVWGLCLLAFYFGVAVLLARFVVKPQRAWLTGAFYCFIAVVLTYFC